MSYDEFDLVHEDMVKRWYQKGHFWWGLVFAVLGVMGLVGVTVFSEATALDTIMLVFWVVLIFGTIFMLVAIFTDSTPFQRVVPPQETLYPDYKPTDYAHHEEP